MVGFRGLFNLFLPQFFEMRCADWKWICIYLAVRIYGLFFEDVYKSIKKKEIAKANEMMDENANFCPVRDIKNRILQLANLKCCKMPLK